VNGGNRITLDNTLDERLRLLEDRVRLLLLPLAISHLSSQMLPEIRKDLYGTNENRKFYT
jgi:V-type H+-transporting ATPase subunit E